MISFHHKIRILHPFFPSQMWNAQIIRFNISTLELSYQSFFNRSPIPYLSSKFNSFCIVLLTLNTSIGLSDSVFDDTCLPNLCRNMPYRLTLHLYDFFVNILCPIAMDYLYFHGSRDSY